ncbi:MAG: hypothetical protein ACTSO8_07470, partial [Promethearchaeota archaeon]
VNGIYYYIIIAGDFSSNSSISNCIEVNVEIQPNITIPRDFFFIYLLTLVILVSLIIGKVKYSSKLKNSH